MITMLGVLSLEDLSLVAFAVLSLLLSGEQYVQSKKTKTKRGENLETRLIFKAAD